ncbi:MAG: diguanylate cyclase [Eubacteriales bacterium]|nr:diguanylate cyclase [Eubacteriales bacterium]
MVKAFLNRNMILADVLTRNFKNRQEQLDYVLHEALKLTESQYGYVYLYDEEKQEFLLNSWTKSVIENCEVVMKPSVYKLDNTGIWGEVVRQKKPIIINDFEQPNPHKKGYPKGHVALKKFMSVPVIIDEKIVAVVGFANKNSDYDENDVYEMTLLMSGIWNALERREAQEKLTLERNKYLQTLISIGDGVMVVDKNGHVEMLNRAAEKLTGWSFAEAFGKLYREILVLSCEQGGMTINDPIEEVFVSDTILELRNHAILISRDNTKYFLEYSAAPIKDDSNSTVGIVLVFRDVTEKKEQREKIEYLSFHDSLTGLYNRRFFEEVIHRLDTQRNLPISIIMGDVNGLKLTNDIFGHAFGDILLQKVADILHRVSRTDDVIARWGGDEFVLLLPKTNSEETKQIIKQIKDEFAKEQIKAIKGSISMGADTKQNPDSNLVEVLNKAEERMYLAKILECDKANSAVIDSIIHMLHENNPREKEHSVRVSELCRDMGIILKLSEIEIRKLEDAGYLHDIGKVVLEPELLKKKFSKTNQEWNEIKKHPIIGYRILNSFDHTLDLAEIVLDHQERWDGSGYPKGLKGEEIPKLARIIALAESYERKVSGADNFEAMSKEDALIDIRANAGKHFDPDLTETFIKMMEADHEKERSND